MSSAELDDIIASMEAALRRAYALGRKDALDHFKRYLESDEVVSGAEPRRLALAAPEESLPPPASSLPDGAETAAMPGGGDMAPVEPVAEPPGDQRPEPAPRSRFGGLHIPADGRPARGGLVEAIRDFVW
jgi:hypothetical protein